MSTLATFLTHNELLLLFVVVTLGLLLGKVKIRGFKLGVAGVLFAGLGLSAFFSPHELHIAHQIKEIGLILFVYCVGITSAPGFFSAWRNRGIRLNIGVLIALGAGVLIALVGGRLLGLNPGQMAGVFAGALTNTPALGAATEQLSKTPYALDPALAYSITYPFGVLGGLLALRGFFAIRQKRFIDEQEKANASETKEILSVNCRVTNPEFCDRPLHELAMREKSGIVLSRLRRGEEIEVPYRETQLQIGDIVTVVGAKGAVNELISQLGEVSSEQLQTNRGRVDMRRILVSKHSLVGKKIGDLHLGSTFGAQITRLRRADLDLVPTPAMRLEIGDRLRVVAPKDRLKEIAQLFGDSERELALVDALALSIGISLGLLLARVPIPLFGTQLSLGIAGGPLVVALILGRLGRTGRLTWSIPYETNTAFREIGLLLFLAGVGVSAGGQLMSVMNMEGLRLFLLGALVTTVTAAVALTLFHTWGKASVIGSMGATTGVQTQPANLAAAYEMSGRSEETYVAYSLVYPVAMIGKIMFAQVIALLSLLG